LLLKYWILKRLACYKFACCCFYVVKTKEAQALLLKSMLLKSLQDFNKPSLLKPNLLKPLVLKAYCSLVLLRKTTSLAGF